MKAANSNNEYVPQLIGWVVVALIGFLLGPVGLGATLLPALAVWYFGTANPALYVGAFGGVVLGLIVVLGGLAEGLAGIGYTLVNILPAVDQSAMALIELWWGSLAEPWTPILQGALGMIIGAVPCLIYSDRQLDKKARSKKKPPETPALAQRQRALSSQSGPAGRGRDVVLGTEWTTGNAVVLAEIEYRTPTLVMGASGAGKTTTEMNMIEAAIDRGDPVLMLDGKGDPSDAPKVIDYAKAKGRRTYLIMPDHEASASYTPFVGTDHTMMTDMVMGLREWSEDHYRVLLKRFLQLVFYVLVIIGKPIDLLSVSQHLQPSELMRAIRKHRKKFPEPDRLMNRVAQMSAHEKELVGLTGLVDPLIESSLAALFDTRSGRPVLNLRQAREEGAVVMVSLPPLRYEDAARSVGHLFISDLRATLTLSKKPWVIVLDELTSFSGPTVLNLVNQGRAYGARLVLGTQSFADLNRSVQSGGEAFADQILASVNSLVTHRLNSPNDAELAARITGTFLKEELTAQVVGQVETGVGSSRLTREFFVSPDDLKTSQTGEAYLVVKSSNRMVHLRARQSPIVK